MKHTHRKPLTPDQKAAMIASLDDLTEVAKMVNEDFQAAFGNAALGDGFKARTLIRTLFAGIEAYVFRLGGLLEIFYGLDLLTLSAAELAILRDEIYRIKDNGEVQITKAKSGILARLRFTFKLLNRYDPRIPVVDAAGINWNELTSLIKVRDGLMHPKTAKDLSITLECQLVTIRVGSWFIELLKAPSACILENFTPDSKKSD